MRTRATAGWFAGRPADAAAAAMADWPAMHALSTGSTVVIADVVEEDVSRLAGGFAKVGYEAS
jgi:hypothetical protein